VWLTGPLGDAHYDGGAVVLEWLGFGQTVDR